MKLNPPLLALAAGAFGIGVTEFAPMGLLPVIAADLGVSIPAAGLLISAYALGVVLGAPLMTLTTGRVRRRTLLIGLAALFTLGNVLAAISDNYAALLAARLITSLNHGAFFGVGAIVAASIVPPGRSASAVAAMFMGLTLANVVGVPLATWAGDQVGWRAAFWGIAGLGGVTMLALRLTLPILPAPAGVSALGADPPHGSGRAWTDRARFQRHVHGLYLYRPHPAERDRSLDRLHHRHARHLWDRPDPGELAWRKVR